ncbi:glycosyltransferase [Rhizobiales bacterium L72]|uniref:Glycosyltransferase n=2 Tax=Propylenella binzhouense TaxID=2555902 RepID=A0A964T8R4_9HYPH|nr:glycosyltransferase [Propylenella binzhouense]
MVSRLLGYAPVDRIEAAVVERMSRAFDGSARRLGLRTEIERHLLAGILGQLFGQGETGERAEVVLAILEAWGEGGRTPDLLPLFDPAYYAEAAGIAFEGPDAAFGHWLREGVGKRIVPTPFFDPDFYAGRNPDLAGWQDWIFLHYASHGFREGRPPDCFVNPSWIRMRYATGSVSPLQFYLAEEAAGRPVQPAPNVGPFRRAGSSGELLTLRDFLILRRKRGLFPFGPDSELQAEIRKAAAIEPRIKVVDQARLFTLKPFDSPLYPYLTAVQQRVGEADILVYRDSVTFGGVDRVLLFTLRYLEQKYPEARIKVVSFGPVDSRQFTRHHLRTEFVALDALVGNAEATVRRELAFDSALGSGAHTIVNMNCGPLWDAIQIYGRRLTERARLFAFMFCDDRDVFGNVDGYPTRYALDCLPFLNKIFVDSYYLRDTLRARFGDSSFLRSRLSVFRTPFDFRLRELGAPRPAPSNEGPVVAWAGRLDRQKRPDLLAAIAQLMPEATFHVWGEPVLDRLDLRLSSLANVRMMGLFDDLSEVMALAPDAFLYTSEWDGIPTILLMAMMHDVPIVASAAGGVPEVLPETSLVRGLEDVPEYVARLRAAFEAPEPLLEAQAGKRDQLRNLHNFDVFSWAVEAI